MISEAIILTHGYAALVGETKTDLPLCMTPVAGHPFLYYVIRHLEMKGVDRFIFSLGQSHEVVKAYLRNHFPALKYVCVVEKDPLPSGNAIANALAETMEKNVLVQHGNIFFKIDLHALAAVHQKENAECTIALKPVKGTDQYGSVLLGDEGRILSFEEKKYIESGDINGGVYLLDKDRFLGTVPSGPFSFEQDYLTPNCAQKKFYGVVQDRCFVDIVLPSEVEKAQVELKHFPFPFDVLDRTWTLFLDRDGVININKDDGYVVNREEFIFKEGALEAICRLSDLFGKIIVITNQRGVGKGLMSEADLHDIHHYMNEKITFTCGRIDDIFFCTSIDDGHPDRKPAIGMAMKAKEKYPEIDFSKSIMIGDKAGDMQWGRNIGALTVWIPSIRYKGTVDPADIDLTCGSLYEFAHLLQLNE